MPTITDATVTLNGLQDLIDFAVANNEQFSGTYELLNYCNSQIAQQPFRFSSLTTEEQWSTAISDILENNGFTINYDGNGKWSSTVFPNVESVTSVNPINSNNNTTTRGTVRNFFGSKNTLSQDGNSITRSFTRFPKSGGLGAQAQYILGSIGSAIGAVSSGIWAGKTIDSLLYNANPNFWDSIGWSGLDPSTWGALTAGSDSPFAGLLNFVLGIDPETQTAQAYLDENTLAYMLYGMKTAGVFDSGYRAVLPTEDLPFTFDSLSGYPTTQIIPSYGTQFELSVKFGTSTYLTQYYATSTPVFCIGFYPNSFDSGVTYDSAGPIILYSDSSFLYNYAYNQVPTPSTSARAITYNDQTYYVAWVTYPYVIYPDRPTPNINNGGELICINESLSSNQDLNKLGWLLADNTYYGGGVDGIGNQTGATIPNTDDWDDVASTLASLKQQYPDVFVNPMIWDDDYGTSVGNTKTYIPVPFPYAPTNYNQPVSSNPENDQQQQTQTSTQIDPQTDPKTLTDILAKIVQQTQTETQPQPDTPTPNPTDTGTGTTDPPIPPTGTGSALWSVYNPTQAQINSFGGWLWSGDIITQIQQILQNPMEGIIALHKVFAQPVVSGTGDIVVGRLSSGVSSNLVTNQYSYVDCGTVDLLEQFGNVFDYDPHTSVSLYLPFIGIVPLNTSDVMRGSITVKYGVDVFTGACLAMVTVTRDGNTVNMYQYSGVASVSYPLTGAQNSGLIGGLLSIAGGVASIATGNVIGGVIGTASGIGAAAKTHMQRASGFSGNAGAMGIKIPYLIIERPQTKVASTFTSLQGYPTNTSIRLGDCNGQVRVRAVHVEGLGYATENEQKEIENLLYSGVLI